MFYPIDKFFLYDSVNTQELSKEYLTNPFDSLKRLAASIYKEEALKREIIFIVTESISDRNFNVLDALFDYFPDLLFSNIKFSKDDFKSPYIRQSGQTEFLTAMNFRLNLDKINDSLIHTREVAQIDESILANELFKFIYRTYFKLISANYSISNNPNNKHFCEILKDFEKYEDFKGQFRRNLDRKSFKVTSEIEDFLSKREFIDAYEKNYLGINKEKHDKLIDFFKTTHPTKLKQLLRQSIVFHDDVDVKFRNRHFLNLMVLLFKIYLNQSFDVDKNDATYISLVRQTNRTLKAVVNK